MRTPKGIRHQERLSEHSTLRIGGLAEYFAEPTSEAELSELVHFASSSNLSLTVIGHGTNVLFDDAGFDGLVIKIGSNLSAIDINEITVNVQAGAWVPFVARAAQSRGLAGLEHIVGIPGTVGGLIIMNGGSLRKSIGDSIRSVRVLSPDGVIAKVEKKECDFSYRASAFQTNESIVVGAELTCRKTSREDVRKDMLKILRDRRRKFPRKSPNCGSVFKSDPKNYAEFGTPGEIIESLGFKGRRIGGAEVSRHHANFIVNTGGARSVDYLALIDEIKEKAWATYGVSLELELVVIR